MNTNPKIKAAFEKITAILRDLEDDITQESPEVGYLFLARIEEQGGIGNTVSLAASKHTLNDMLTKAMVQREWLQQTVFQIGFEKVVLTNPILAIQVAPILADMEPTKTEQGECDCPACQMKKALMSRKPSSPNPKEN